MQILTDIVIDAPPEAVWAVLTDFPRYPDWNPFITSISGDLTPGARLTVRIRPPGGTSMTFRPRILSVKPGQTFVWLGHLLLPHVLDGEHSFKLNSSTGGTQTSLQHSETFSGFLMPLLMNATARRRTEAGFSAMNNALKRRAETLPR